MLGCAKIIPLVDKVLTAFHLRVGEASGYTDLTTSGDYSIIIIPVIIGY